MKTGEKIRRAIEVSGISINEFSRLMGITQQGLYKIFQREKVKMGTILQVCKILNLDPSYFNEGETYFKEEEKVIVPNPHKNQSEESSPDYWKTEYKKMEQKLEEMNSKYTQLLEFVVDLQKKMMGNPMYMNMMGKFNGIGRKKLSTDPANTARLFVALMPYIVVFVGDFFCVCTDGLSD